MSALASFGPATRAWFAGRFGEPTPVQERGWAAIAGGAHVLMLAPTGSGKTLAAFLWAIDRLERLDRDAPKGPRVVYVSPLKALVYDVERNLQAPLAGIRAMAHELGVDARLIGVDVRTGDTTQSDRVRQRKSPSEILVTTPESLFLRLQAGDDSLAHVETVIVDEIHAVAGTKRGVHLAVTLERLSERCKRDPQRIGLSATQRPLDEIAAYLGGDRPVTIVDAHAPPRMELHVEVPVEDLDIPVKPALPGERLPSAWEAIHPRLLELIRAHRSTIVFVNSRILCERISIALNALAGEEIVRAHHGSLARERRQETEDRMKRGDLPGIVATSSLELGIDMGAVDLVLQIESPGSVSRGLQRVGRAGHQVGGTSKGYLFPKWKGDLLEAAVVAERMRAGAIEQTHVPRNCLDVLAQQIVAMVAERERSVGELHTLLRRTLPYRDLSREALDAVLDMLAGRYPSEDFGELRARIAWDRAQDRVRARAGAGVLVRMNAGTIPDRGLYGVHHGPKGPRIGELDEEMVHETKVGDRVVLGASTWRVAEIGRDRVIVDPAPGEPGRMPFWKGRGLGRPVELGRAVGAFAREISALPTEAAVARLTTENALNPQAARNLLAYLRDEIDATGALPTDTTIVVARFRDEVGDWRVCMLTPFGDRVHAPWALALEATLGVRRGFALQMLHGDDGIALKLPDVDAPPDVAALFPDPDEVEDRVMERLGESSVFASHFRENAARALLLPRRTFGRRTPLWAQRQRSANLLAVAKGHAGFPIVLETYREILREVFDLPALVEILRGVRDRSIRVHEVETRGASPMAKTLAFAWVAGFLYDQDQPLAERRAQALVLDRDLLRDLLGEASLRDLLDPEVIADVERTLQRVEPERHATSADTLHDVLRGVGDLTDAEIAARCDSSPDEWLASLWAEKRAVRVKIAGELRWVSSDDSERFRDGAPLAVALRDVLVRYARTHGPFNASGPALRYSVDPDAVQRVLEGLVADARLERGSFLPGRTGQEWCDPDVLRRIRRASLAQARGQAEAVPGSVFQRFLIDLHGVGSAATGTTRLREVVAQLEGVALPWSEIEASILPARIADFRSAMLDELGALGEIAWVGRGALGTTDGRVALYRRDRVPLLVTSGTFEGGPVHVAILAHLERRGACFLAAIAGACGGPLDEVVACLWDLAWAGVVTNDTVAPLRELGRGAARSAGGRWSLVRDLVGAGTDATHQLAAEAENRIERYGIVAKDAAEDAPTRELIAVLRAMEDQGRLRRGHFVQGFVGAQFATPSTVDRLRGRASEAPRVEVLAAVDPASPWGALLPWPHTGGRPRRAAGAVVVSFGGEPVLFLDKSTAASFDGLTGEGVAAQVVTALRTWLARRRLRSFRIERMDGAPAASHPKADRLVGGGMLREREALLVTRDP